MNGAVLRAEIDATPGLAALIAEGQDSAVAEALNTVQPGLELARRVPVEEFLGLLDPREMPAVDTPERTYLDLVLAQRAVLLSAEALINLATVFGAGSNSMAAVKSASKRQASRAEALFGQSVTQDDVSACYAEEREAAYHQAQAPLDAKKAGLDAAISAYLRAAPDDRAARAADVRMAQDALKAEHEKGGVVFADNEAPSVIELGALG